MRHLGARTSVYVDGRLVGRRLARAEAHVGSCEECARLVAAERDLRNRLRGLGGAEPPADLPARILSAARPCETRWERVVQRTADRVSLPSWRRRVAGRLAAGAGLVTVATVAVLLVGGVPPAPPGVLRAGGGDGVPVRTTLQASVSDTTEATVEALRSHGWAFPDEVPSDLHISGARLHEVDGIEVLEVEIVGPSGAARVLEVRGGLTAVDLPADAQLVQCGAVAVVLTGDAGTRARVATLLPAAPVDSSVVGRFDRGVHAIASFLREVSP